MTKEEAAALEQELQQVTAAMDWALTGVPQTPEHVIQEIEAAHRYASAPIAKRKTKALTPARIRTRKIRGLLSKPEFDVRPDRGTYAEWMDRAKIAPPPRCQKHGHRGTHAVAESVQC